MANIKTYSLFSLPKVQTDAVSMLRIVDDMMNETALIQNAIKAHLQTIFKNCDANQSLYDVFASIHSMLFYKMENKALEHVYRNILANFKKTNADSPQTTAAIDMLEALKFLKSQLNDLQNIILSFAEDQYKLSRHAYDLFEEYIQNPAYKLQNCVEQYLKENKKENPELSKLCHVLVYHEVQSIADELLGRIGSKTQPLPAPAA